ncbi:MAG: hypothetical protein PHV68_06190 [Candidatus Gastranaerophilales bacterium]|nr:hypothetical protein [Candidatus Gastranaerophilales bacterium]
MKKKILVAIFALIFSVNMAVFAQTKAPVEKPVSAVASVSETINPLDLVNNPKNYLNRQIKIKADFDKFSTLGLDYKPAFMDSQKYIGFLIQRADVKNNVIPLSELKLFLTREKAEELIDLESGDEIEFSGKVFSTALGDPWVEVTDVSILNTKSKKVSKKD